MLEIVTKVLWFNDTAFWVPALLPSVVVADLLLHSWPTLLAPVKSDTVFDHSNVNSGVATIPLAIPTWSTAKKYFPEELSWEIKCYYFNSKEHLQPFFKRNKTGEKKKKKISNSRNVDK